MNITNIPSAFVHPTYLLLVVNTAKFTSGIQGNI